jgi:hypothetical protein
MKCFQRAVDFIIGHVSLPFGDAFDHLPIFSIGEAKIMKMTNATKTEYLS